MTENAYRDAFVRLHRQLWTSYCQTIGQRILDRVQRPGLRVLDLCCGSAELAVWLAARGHSVTGVDLAPDMLALGRELALEKGVEVELLQQDVVQLEVTGTYDLVVSISHSLSHLPDLESLRACFVAAREAAAPDAWLVFDLITRLGLSRWNNLSVEEQGDYLLVKRGFFDPESGRGFSKMTGCLRNEQGSYDRFDALLAYQGFWLAEVEEALAAAGWREVTICDPRDLGLALDVPESKTGVVFTARTAPR